MKTLEVMRQKGIIFKGLKLLDSIKLWDYSALTSFVIWVNVIDNRTVAEDLPVSSKLVASRRPADQNWSVYQL